MTRDEVAAAIIARVIPREGGIKDVGDGKGVTRFGQTPDWLERFGLPLPETPDQAASNYRTWITMTGLIGLCDVDDSLADIAIDIAVHETHERSIRSVQSAIGVKPDGHWGPQTSEALSRSDRLVAAASVLADAINYLGEIITARPEKHAKNAKGWMRRRTAQLRQLIAEARGVTR